MSVKKIRLYFRGKRIEDQYSLDLQYNLTPQDFHLILALFNEATHLNPPPGPTVLWLITLFLLWITFGALAYLLWIKFSSFYIFITIPIFLIASTLAMSMLRKNKKLRFEASILQICSQLNATENIRGINFSFIKDTKDLALDSTRSTTRTKSVYVIDIEIDNRYAALRSHQFNFVHLLRMMYIN
ncbi:hypothetical protein BD560DRAFT_494605 [Blakeslea trispora]|nr:hypothetical protein BD560DRAFT_494605 [Blakeslea trispora]